MKVTQRGFEMKVIRSGKSRTLKLDGKSYLVPKTITTSLPGGKTIPVVHASARFGSCKVNGKKVGKTIIRVTYGKVGVSMKSLVVMRALSQTLIPMSGPAQNKMHIIAAARIMKEFDVEHPDSGILDTDVVTVSSKRHVYVRESTFLAGKLRGLDVHVQLGLLAASLLRDKAVMSTTLDPAPESSTCMEESAATERALLDAGVVEQKLKPVRSKGPRSITCDDGTSWIPPRCVYRTQKNTHQGLYQGLLFIVKMKMCQVNGRNVGRTVSVGHTRRDINKRTMLAMSPSASVHDRATRDTLFPIDEPGRYEVHRVVAALVLRAFDLKNPGSDILDETVVTVRIGRHGYVKESSYVAGDLRVMNRNEVAILTELFLKDPEAMSGELEPAPASASTGSTTRESDSSTASCKRAEESKEEAAKRADEARISNPTTEPACSSDATVVGEKRIVSGDNMDSLPLPSGIYLDAEDGGSKTIRLKVNLGAVWVNGEECVLRKKVKIVGGVALHVRNVAALRSLRDDIALGLGASPPVKMIIAAKAFRSWLRRRRDSLIPDSAIVTVTDGADTRTTASLRRRIVSTAGNLRGVDVEKPRVVRELLSALGGTLSDREDELESQPAVVVSEAEGVERVEAREGGAPSVEEPWVGGGTHGFSAQRPKKRKLRNCEETCRVCDEAVRGHVKEGKKRKAKGGREVRKRNSSSGGHEGAEDDSAVRKAENTVIDLASDSSVEATKSKKRKREGEGPSVCGVKCSVAMEEGTRKKSKSAGGSTKGSARQKGVTGPASTPYEEHTKTRENRREQQPTYSGEPTRLGAPIKGLKKTNTGEVGKRSRCSVAQEGSAQQESATRKAKMDRKNLAPAVSAKHPSKKRRREKKSKSEGSLLSDESTHSDGPLKSEDAKKGRAGKESQGRSSSRSRAPEGGAQECTARIGERAIIDLTADPPDRQIKKKKKKKKSRKRTKRQSREAENPCRVETGHPLVKSRKKKLMDWIANG